MQTVSSGQEDLTSGGKRMRDPFFTADNGFPTIRLALEDILPEEMTSALVKGRAVIRTL
jgi:hypothetical protein